MFGLLGKRSAPLSAERWVGRQTRLTIGVFMFAGVLWTIASFVPVTVEPTFYLGSLFIVAAFVFSLLFLRRNVEGFYNHYVATFKKDNSMAIDKKVIRISYLCDIGLVAGTFFMLLGLFFTFTAPSSIRQVDAFEGESAPSGYTWVVFTLPNDVPEGRELALRTGNRQNVYFVVERFSQGRVGFLVPSDLISNRNLTILSFNPMEVDREKIVAEMVFQPLPDIEDDAGE